MAWFLDLVADFLRFADFGVIGLGSFSPTASKALGQGPRKALIRDRVGSSKSSLRGSLPSSSAFCLRRSIAKDFFSSVVTYKTSFTNHSFSTLFIRDCFLPPFLLPANTKRACRKYTAGICGFRTHAPLQRVYSILCANRFPTDDRHSQTRKWGLFRIRTEFLDLFSLQLFDSHTVCILAHG